MALALVIRMARRARDFALGFTLLAAAACAQPEDDIGGEATPILQQCAKDMCGEACVSLDSDPNNCGQCGRTCPEATTCAGGQCQAVCDGEQASCADGCAEITTDSLNCGGCGHACVPGQACKGGQCVAACSPPLRACDDECVDVQVDAANCGACGFICGVNETCEAGQCVALCSGALSSCAGACVDLSVNPWHCGACGYSCGPGGSCSQGKCSDAACAPGLVECEGACVDLAADANHCGACGKKCVSGDCFQGVCQVACATGLESCAGSCVDPMSDDAHCGGCNHGCSADSHCEGGACVQSCDPTKNLAPTATAVSTAKQVGEEQYGYGPSRMQDGKGYLDCATEKWHWLGVAFGSLGYSTYTWSTPQTIKRIEVETGNACSGTAVALASATVQWWDGNAWVTAGSLQGSGAIRTFTFPTEVITTQLRLYSIKPQLIDRAAVIYEWKVFGC
ncbi:MAG: hypothetical protein R3B13_04735 [Polyangiaceae bacterium]